MRNTGCWNYSKKYLSCLVVFMSLFLQIESVIACEAPPEVCDWKKKIVGLKTDNMIASGILIDGGLIITNRHVVEDYQSVLVRDLGGNVYSANVIPHNIQIDLAILVKDSNKIVPNIKRDFAKARSQNLYVVAFDQGRNAARVYEPSSFAYYPNLKKYPLARIHSNARALPGNSGGAVVNQHGSLVGILASGDRRFSEIIPSTKLEEVFASLNEKHSNKFFETGGLIRRCADALYAAADIIKNPPNPIVNKIERNCYNSHNRQLIDQAGQTFGRWWMFGLSEKYLKKSESMDPFSPNTLMSLAVTYHLSRNSEQSVKILKRYLEMDPENHQALRMSIQGAGAVGDKIFADRVLELMKKHNPSAVPLAESFLESAFSD
jgi:hypothetical protein